MAETFTLGQNDTWPPIQATLRDAAGAPVNLTGATVRANMRGASGPLIVDNASATILSAAAGTVEYAWIATDTAAAGNFSFEWEVTFSTGKIATFPNTTDKIEVIINAELG